jgi:DNA repair protein RadC
MVITNGVCEATIAYRRTKTGLRCGSCYEAHYILSRIIPQDEQEHFLLLALGARNDLLAWAEIGKGSVSSCPVHPRDVFRTALQLGAVSVIGAHNHPSGSPEPSADDLSLTRRLVKAGELVGIPMVDHIIIGDDGFVSLAERGVI